MKHFMLAAALLLLAVACGVSGYFYSAGVSGRMEEALEAVRVSAEEGAWADAHQSLARAQTAWDESRGALSLFVSDKEIAGVDMALCAAASHLERRDAGALDRELRLAVRLVGDICEAERPTWSNVL